MLIAWLLAEFLFLTQSGLLRSFYQVFISIYGPVFLIRKENALFAFFYLNAHNFLLQCPRVIYVYTWLTRNQEEDGPEIEISLSHLGEEN